MSEDNKFKVKTVEVNDGGTYGKLDRKSVV